MKKFQFYDTKLGAKLVTPFVAPDERGIFVKDYNIEIFPDFRVAEILNVKSKKGVLRGMHAQYENPQAKIVRCIRGHIYDVIVDIRKNSSTYGQWEGFHLSEDNLTTLYIPKDFLHGYLVLEDDTYVQYMCDEVHDYSDISVYYADKDLNIEWPFDLIGGRKNLIVSSKDNQSLAFENLKFIRWGV